MQYVKKLVRFLKLNKIHGTVLYNIAVNPATIYLNESTYQRICRKFTLLDEYVDNPKDFFYNAFMWSSTKEGHEFWSHINYLWSVKN